MGREQQGGTGSLEESLFLAAKKGERQGDRQGCLCPLAAVEFVQGLEAGGHRRRGSEKIFPAIFFERYSRMKPAPVAHKRRRDCARQHAGSKSPGCMHGRGTQLCPRVLAWTTGGPFSSVDGGLRNPHALPLPLTSRSSCCAAWPVGALQACRSGIVAPPRVVMWRMVPTPASCVQQCACAGDVEVCFGACAIGAANGIVQEPPRERALSPRVPKPQLRNAVLQQDSCVTEHLLARRRKPALHKWDAEGSPNGFNNKTLGALRTCRLLCSAHASLMQQTSAPTKIRSGSESSVHWPVAATGGGFQVDRQLTHSRCQTKSNDGVVCDKEKTLVTSARPLPHPLTMCQHAETVETCVQQSTQAHRPGLEPSPRGQLPRPELETKTDTRCSTRLRSIKSFCCCFVQQ